LSSPDLRLQLQTPVQEIDMDLCISMRVTADNQRGSVLAVMKAGVVRVAWDGGGVSHRPIATLTALGKDTPR
jgi:hypothetical protein